MLICPLFPVPLYLPPHGCWLIVALPLVLLECLPTVRLYTPVESGCASLPSGVGPILHCLELTMLPILLGKEMSLLQGGASCGQKATAGKRFLFRMLGQPNH